MTLYFENPVNFPESGSISVNSIWHQNAPLLAVASFSQERGGFVIIFDELGESLKDLNYPVHRSYQVTALVWHPEKTILVSGWENGDLKVWNGSDKEFLNVVGPHKAPITLLYFSEKGGRLISCDSSGSLVGWKVDTKGQTSTVFHLDLKESVTHLTFRQTIKSHPDFDLEGLAKAAVNGDEHALDMFSNWRPKTTARKFKVQDGSDNMCFFIGTHAGCIYYVNTSGTCTEVLDTDGTPLSFMVYHPFKDALIIVMEGLTVGYFSVDHQGRLTETAKVKLSGRIHTRSVGSQGLTWAGNSNLAVLTESTWCELPALVYHITKYLVGELTVRIWDIDSNDNYVLPTTMKLYTSEDKSHNVSEIFTCLAYCKLNQTLCAGTNIGRIYFWTRNPNIVTDNPEDCWELNNVSTISGTIKQIMWGSVLFRLPLLSVNCVTSVYIMKEQTICSSFCDKIWVTQKTASQLLLESVKGSYLLDVGSQVSDVAVSENSLVATNGRTVNWYDLTWKENDKIPKTGIEKDEPVCDFTVKLLSTFNCDNDGLIIHQKTVISINSQKVTIYSSTGATIAHLTSSMSEGEPIGMDVTGQYLTIFTMEGYLKIYDLGESQPKLITPFRNMYDMFDDFGEIIQAKTNSDKKVALTIAAANLMPDRKLYIWDIETNEMSHYNFYKFSEEDIDMGIELSNKGEDENQMYEICSNRMPLALFWAEEDSRLLVCDAKKIKTVGNRKGFGAMFSKKEQKTLKDEEHIIVTMFVSSESGIKIHDIRATDTEARLLGVAVPYIITLEKSNIVRNLMSDFSGLENCNRATKEAVLDFSYNLALGNMDAAFRSIKLVQSKGVWESLARMCVKTRRLDVATVCLGHMGDAKAARALRIAAADETLPQEAQVAVLAVYLGMLDEAEQLYVKCDRYDLLNRLLRSRNKIEDALNIAETKDRINLKNTEHAWGRILEQNGDFKKAAVRYEKANTHRYDVPRMLNDNPQQLQAYMVNTKDKEMLKWWGQFVESQGDMNAALKIYSSAGDVYSQVRVLCFLGDELKAAELARSSNDKAAFYHMARYYETVANFEEAVNFFMKATAYFNAVRLCKENDMADELWNLGVVVQNREKTEIAKYFEEQNDLEKAVILYHRGGMLHKALDLAFKTQHFDVLQEIATQLDSESDPILIEKCAEYFVTNEQFDKAVDLLAIAKKYKEAIDLCLKHNVVLTEDLTEKLRPEKDTVDEELRLKVLESLAESLMLQGDYHLATKKFTQAGDKVRAMKALLKSGDTEKIIFFAGISRQREIYIMAANYLQSLDWQNKPEILRNIITFYSKGKAVDLLANFYVACAQVEIDEFQNYEKAFGALTEASRCLQKITSPKEPNQIQRAMDIVQQRLTNVKRFVDIRRLFERGDTQAGMTQCRQFLMTGGQDLEAAVRRGDIYALMIHNYVKQGEFSEAKQLCLELRQLLSTTGNTPLTYYVNKEVLEALAQGLGVSVSSFIPVARKSSGHGDESETVEEIVEE